MAGVLENRVFVRARRGRWVFGALAVICLVAFMATANRAALLMYGNWAIGVSGGCFEIGRDPNARQWSGKPGTGAAVVFGQPWTSGEFASAWRPFRAGGATSSRLLFPLWQPLLIATALCAVCHGMLIGARRADRGCCMKCGYDLSAIAAVKGAGGGGLAGRTCPECGEVDRRG